MICEHCGAQAPESARFCPGCGKSMKAGPPTIGVADTQCGASGGPPTANVPPRPRSHGRVLAIGLFLAMLLLLLLAFGTGNSAETTRACIAARGSGGGCPSPMLPKIFFVLALGAGGLGLRYWNR